ncbi:hypothetical protein PSCICE_35300 [Pseudomonas cichorii]|nr:hypothetical protein PSCICE_35300 [Pseudomonas cichorii]
MLSRQQYISFAQLLNEGCITRLTGRLLDTGARLHPHSHALKGNTEFQANLSAMLRPGIGSGLQAVMNMDGIQRRQALACGELSQKVQQYGGVQTAGKTDMPDRRVTPGSQDLKQSGGEIVSVHRRAP